MDPETGPVQRFATELRKLRQEAGGLPYRSMAKRAGYSITTLSQAAAGERLPSLPVVLAFVEACGADASEWEARWQEVTQELARERESHDDDGGPYLGLAPYETGDRDRFFGREKLVEELRELLGRHRFAAVFGPSGSGKSSLLRAGLVPAVRGQTASSHESFAEALILTPGEHPMRHAERLVPAAGEGETLIVVDQFEEVFTLCQDQDERARFIDLLLGAWRAPSSMRVVIAVRADFYGHCAGHRELTEALREANLLVGPMRQEELREAVVRPAMAQGLTVERALTAAIVADVADEPGALPLMSHALREVWRRRTGKLLTLDAYERIGRVQGAISHTAEELYAGLSPEQARIARRILLRLIQPGEQAQDTRRPAAREELHPYGEADTALVIERLAAARLLTLHQDTVDLAHEALIESWPRLRGWVDEGRDRLRAHRQLTEAAQAWQAQGGDAGLLYRGTRLAVVDKLFIEPGDHDDDLTPVERDFVRASAALARRTSLRRIAVSAALVVLLVASMVAAGIAARQAGLADDALKEATAQLTARRAAALRLSDPKLARRLSVAAWRIAPVPEAKGELVSSMALPVSDVFADPDSAASAHALSADGARLAAYTAGGAGAPGTLRVLDVAAKNEISRTPLAGDVEELAWSPDGHTLAVSGQDGVRLVPVGAASAGIPLTGPAEHLIGAKVEFSPSGGLLVAEGDRTEVWNVARRERVLTRRVVAISPDDRLALVIPRKAQEEQVVEVTSEEGPMLNVGPKEGAASPELWDLGKRRQVSAPWLPMTAIGGAFSPDGKLLAVTAAEGIRLFDLDAGKELEGSLIAGTEPRFSPDGRFLAGLDGADRVNLWRVHDGELLLSATLPLEDVRHELRISADDRTLRVQSARGLVHELSVAPFTMPATLAPDKGDRVLSPDGRVLVVSGQNKNRPVVRLWDVATRQPLGDPLPAADLPSDDMTQPEYEATFSPDGSTLALHHSMVSVVTLWDVATRKQVGAIDAHRLDVTGVKSVAFSADGATMAVSLFIDGSDELELWDVATRTRTASAPEAGGDILAFTPDGRRLFAGSGWQGVLVDTATGGIVRDPPDARAQGSVLFTRGVAVTGDFYGRVGFWGADLRQPLVPPQNAHPATISALLSHPPSGLMASVSEDNESGVRLWDVDGRRPVGSAISLPGESPPTVAFSRTALLISLPDGGLREITVDPGTAIAKICDADGGLTAEEWRAQIPELPYRETCRG
ncbi:nSTAND1 domain-containing NTPase [[Actinomadura] parvosata]|uniref:nSTAND1 domain-containing NTPase n=1 Tax=[Actinomadura] parvosata TaxID=1955412 RepID=UPI00406CCA77